MKRKIIFTLLSLVCAFTCIFSLVACDKDDDTPAASHTHSYQWVDNKDGTHKQHCSVPGCNKPDINEGNHDFTNGDCVCGAKKTADVHKHNYKWVDNKDGTHKQHCSEAGCDKPDINAGKHVFINGVCVCGAKESSQSVHSHKWSADWEMSSTHHWHECTVSGCTVTDNSKKDGYGKHTPGATATETTAQTCTVCGYVITPPLGHKHSTTPVPAKTASCTVNGNIAYYTCTCGKYFADAKATIEITNKNSVVITAPGHKWNTEWTVDEEATTEHAGSKSHHCSRCDEKTDITEIPRLTVTTYNVMFNANGGKIDGKDTKTVTGTVNQKISRPNDPTRTDYTFTGWYKDGATTKKWNFDTDVITGVTTLYAGWAKNATEYDVTFVHNYSGSANVVKSTENGLITYIPARTGYIFNGWYYSDGQTADGSYILSEKFDTSKRVTQSGLTLYAEWVAERTDNSQLYSPSVSISEGGVFSWQEVQNAQGYKVEVYSGANKVAEQSLTATSWTFPNGTAAGYYTVKIRANGNGETTVSSAWTEKYYAHHILGAIAGIEFNVSTSVLTWSAVNNATAYEIRVNNALKATISYTTYDLSEIDAGDYTVSITALREGYSSSTASKTISKKRLGTPNVTVTENSSDCTYTLSWQAVAHADTYRIKHHNTYINVTGTTYTVDNASVIYDSNGIGEFTVCAYDSNADYFISGDCESKIVKKIYLVTLNKSDNAAGNVSPSDGHKVGESVTVSASANRGYTWLGWYDGNKKLTDSLNYTFTMPGENKTFTAKWALYTLTVNCDEGGTVTRDYGVSSYTVSFDLNGAGGTAPQAQIITTTNGLTYPKISGRGGCLFGGWYDNAECEGLPFDFSQGVEADVKLYAKWVPFSDANVVPDETVSVLLVAYYAFVPLVSGDITVENSNYNKVECRICNSAKNTICSMNGRTITFNAVAGNLYYLFLKAYNNGANAFTNIWVGTATPTAGGKASFPVNGGVEVGKSVSLAATTNSGYTWVGWYDGNTKLTNELNYTFTMPSANKTYTAKWCKVTVESSDNSAGSISSLDGKYKVGEKATVVATANVGYTWLGWYDGTTKLTNNLNYTFTMPSVNKTFTAKWKVNDELSNFIFTSTPTTLTITGIKNKAVTEIIVPDYVTSISKGAFSDCGSLTSITLPFVGTSKDATSNNYFGNIFGNYLSDVPSSLKTVIITGGTSIGDYAFEDCSSLTSITIPDSVESIGSDAFINCVSLVSIYYTGDISAWCGITGLGNLMISNDPNEPANPGVPKKRTLYIKGKELTDKIIIPETVTSIASFAFGGCSGITSITIPGNVKSIGSYAFCGCSKLSSVTIGNGVTSIGEWAFWNCSSLTSITIPDSVTSIGDSAFWNCSLLTEIKFKDIASYCQVEDIRCVPKSKVYIGGQKLMEVTSIVIPDGVTSIGYGAFDDCSLLTEIKFKDIASYCQIDGLGYIDQRKVYIGGQKLREMTSIVISDSVTSIGSYVFSGCSSLTSITIPDSVKSIGNCAFRYCSSLTSVTIPDSVTSIGWCAFEDCSSLASVTIPDSVKSIGSSAFSGCDKLIQKENGVSYVDKWIIDCDTSVTNVTLRSGTKGVADSAFWDCSSLTSITIPDSVTSIGHEAFWDCSSLTSITIPDSVASIGWRAFYGCSRLAIYCEAASKPSGWDAEWNKSNRPVVWNYKN